MDSGDGEIIVFNPTEFISSVHVDIPRSIYRFCKNGALTMHYNEIKGLSPEQLSQYEKELNSVGLDYHFEE